jgi:hypothetical protein
MLAEVEEEVGAGAEVVVEEEGRAIQMIITAL